MLNVFLENESSINFIFILIFMGGIFLPMKSFTGSVQNILYTVFGLAYFVVLMNVLINGVYKGF
jgi:hypothetical protein